MNSLIYLISLLLIILPSYQLQTVNLSDLQNQIKLQWTFVSQIQHTWFKNIIHKHFNSCTEHKQLKALYNCQTTIPQYKIFWKQFIQGIEQIKFRKAVEQDDHSWAQMMAEASDQWIDVNKTGDTIEIEEVYEDISEFPQNLMEFAQWTQQFKDAFDDMKQLIKWERTQKPYLNKRDRTDDQIKLDQMVLLKQFLNPKCFLSQQSLETCTIPLQRYTYYLKTCFFYYFDQPQKYSRYQKKTQSMIINPILDFKITKLWRDMRTVMKQHLKMADQVTLDQVEKMTPDILESVMESLIRKIMGQKKPNEASPQETQL